MMQVESGAGGWKAVEQAGQGACAARARWIHLSQIMGQQTEGEGGMSVLPQAAHDLDVDVDVQVWVALVGDCEATYIFIGLKINY